MLLENLSPADDLGLVLLPVLEVACEEICKLLALKLKTLLVLLGLVREESKLVLFCTHVGVDLFIQMLKPVVHFFNLGSDVVSKLLDLHDLLLSDAKLFLRDLETFCNDGHCHLIVQVEGLLDGLRLLNAISSNGQEG